MKESRMKTLNAAFDAATEFVLEKTSCPRPSDISNGWCDKWAAAVKRFAPFVDVRQRHGHWFVVYGSVAYDSDTTEMGFEVPSDHGR
jgi:hypothetical protein